MRYQTTIYRTNEIAFLHPFFLSGISFRLSTTAGYACAANVDSDETNTPPPTSEK